MMQCTITHKQFNVNLEDVILTMIDLQCSIDMRVGQWTRTEVNVILIELMWNDTHNIDYGFQFSLVIAWNASNVKTMTMENEEWHDITEQSILPATQS